MYYFGKCSSVLVELFPLLFSVGVLLVILIDNTVFLSSLQDVTRLPLGPVQLEKDIILASIWLEKLGKSFYGISHFLLFTF